MVIFFQNMPSSCYNRDEKAKIIGILMDNTIENIGHKIKYFRNLNKVSLSKLAKEANISKSTLFGLEEGRSNPTISTLINISKTLNIKLTELIGNSNEARNRVALSQISSVDNSYIYKLSLLANQTFTLCENIYSNIKIIILDGELLDLYENTIISQNMTVSLNYNTKLKASKGGATAIVTITKSKSPNYIIEDIFLEKATTNNLEAISNLTQSSKISRAICSSIYPVEHPAKVENIQILEVLEQKELHYYFTSTFLGLIGGVNYILNKLESKPTNKIENILMFTNRVNTQDLLSNIELQNIPSNPIETLTDELKKLITTKYNNCKLLTDASKLNTLECQSSTYVLIIDELIKEIEHTKNLIDTSTLIDIYRAVELIIPIKEQELTNEELEFYFKTRENLIKALYFAKNNHINLAIIHLEQLINFQKITISHNAMKLYLEAKNLIQKTLTNRENLKTYTTQAALEQKIADLNLEIVIQKEIHPSINSSCKYLYLLKV